MKDYAEKSFLSVPLGYLERWKLLAGQDMSALSLSVCVTFIIMHYEALMLEHLSTYHHNSIRMDLMTVTLLAYFSTPYFVPCWKQ